MNRLTKIFFLLTLTFGAACSELPPEEACGFQRNDFGRRLSWKQLPVKLFVDSSVTPQMIYALELAANEWSQQAFGGHPVVVIDRAPETVKQPRLVPADDKNPEMWVPPIDGFNTVYFSPNARGFQGEAVTARASGRKIFSEAQARTHLSSQGDFIHESDIVINGGLEYFVEESDVNRTNGDVHAPSLLQHEIGHVLGLDHVDLNHGSPSVMNPVLSGNLIRLDLDELTLNNLACEY